MLWNENNMNISKEEVDGMFDEISEIGFEKVLSDIFNNKK